MWRRLRSCMILIWRTFIGKKLICKKPQILLIGKAFPQCDNREDFIQYLIENRFLLATMKVSLIISLLSPLSIVLASVLQSTDKEHQVSGQPDLINEALRLPQLTPRNKHQARNYSFNKLYKLQTTFLDAFIYPNNQAQVSFPRSPFHTSFPLPQAIKYG